MRSQITGPRARNGRKVQLTPYVEIANYPTPAEAAIAFADVAMNLADMPVTDPRTRDIVRQVAEQSLSADEAVKIRVSEILDSQPLS